MLFFITSNKNSLILIAHGTIGMMVWCFCIIEYLFCFFCQPNAFQTICYSQDLLVFLVSREISTWHGITMLCSSATLCKKYMDPALIKKWQYCKSGTFFQGYPIYTVLSNPNPRLYKVAFSHVKHDNPWQKTISLHINISHLNVGLLLLMKVFSNNNSRKYTCINTMTSTLYQ